ncbi:SseB family protein [Paracoccus sp. 1_MG-2023]|uniref:SseB family protein n=1 Tax=unclassified Paracoccus (in: a-proteobacteria) TaxID=2688777 RepID=UPI001C08DAB2|nr:MULTISPECIES: SseB family protein [unclassified Paracoccus (in: a-proteobacteria)]MBU2956472.1 SseB family protein [Paracoccus sp. C2R09]MDO6669724.1 SseB family protein [Paracoccus sp. 1_MG-2023]
MTALDDLATTSFHDAPSPLRARMLSRLADTELFVALTGDPEGDDIELRTFPLEGARVALACDAEDRLAGFMGGPVAYAALPGRVLADLLRKDDTGLLVNPGHPSEMLLDAGLLEWLSGALSSAPEADEARLRLTAPAPVVVKALVQPLSERLADMRGLIAGAALLGVGGEMDGPASHLLLIAGAPEDRQAAIAKSLAETLAFLPEQPGGVDISFSDMALPVSALRFDLTEPEPEPDEPPRPKGPPILR